MTDAERERLAQALGRHYAEDRIDADELSRRLDIVYGEAPESALAGLPPLATVVPEKQRRLWGRRHGEADKPKPGWVPTKERFVDPSTGRVMRVWVDAGSHTRHYVPD